MNKGIVAIIALIIVLIIVAGLIIGGVINFSPVAPAGNNTNNQAGTNTTHPAATNSLCETLDANMSSKLLAIATDKNSTLVLVSPKNEKSSFFLLFKDKNETGVIDNTTSVSSPRTVNEVADLLKSQSVEGVILVSPEKAFVDALKSKQIPCYVSMGALPSIVGATSSTGGAIGQADSGSGFICKDLNLFAALTGKTAVLSMDSNVSSLVSSLGEKSPYILVFDSNSGISAVKNTAPDNNKQVQTFVALLKTNGLKSVVLSSPNANLERELKRNNIACYKAEGIISGVIAK